MPLSDRCTLSVSVLACRGLAAKDLNGKSDPYVVHETPFQSGKKNFKSPVKKGTLAPRWLEIENQSVVSLVLSELEEFMSGKAKVVLKVWDHDVVSSDDFEGQVEIHVAEFLVDGEENCEKKVEYLAGPKWLPLQKRPGKPKDEVTGDISVKITLSIDRGHDELRRCADKGLENIKNPKKEEKKEEKKEGNPNEINKRKPSKQGTPYDDCVAPASHEKLLIMSMCQSGLTDPVASHIAQKKTINFEYRDQYPLNKATEFGGTRVVALLCKNAAKVDEVSPGFGTALYQAAFKDRLKAAEILLDYGANPDLSGSKWDSPLHAVIAKGDNGPFAKLLLEYGADPNLASETKGTPLHAAKKLERVEIIKFLEMANAKDEGPEKEEEEKKEEEKKEEKKEEGEKGLMDLIQEEGFGGLNEEKK